MAKAPLYGLDAELAAKAAEKYDVGLEKQVVGWLTALTGEAPMEEETVQEWLQDGTVLCKAINAIQPGTIKRINTMKAPFKKMENITSFTDAARALGVNENAMFGTPDLYEDKNMGSVINCIYTLAGTVQTTVPSFTGPKLGPPITSTVKDVRRSKAPATQTGGITGAVEQVKGWTGKRDAAQLDQSLAARESVRVDAKGLDADLKEKMAEKFDPEVENQVCMWIEAVTGKQRGDASGSEWLHDGTVLCALGEAIKPGGACKGAVASNLPYKQMENISKFIQFMRDVDVPESSCFSTPDLFEEKAIGIVFQSIYTFGGVVQRSVPSFAGPHIGVAINATVKDANRGIGKVTDQNENMQRTMEVERPKQTGPTAYAK